MFTARRFLALATVLGGAISCGGENSAGPSPSSITGTWQATKVEYVSTTGLGTVDVVALGGSATLVLNADQTFTYVCTLGATTIEDLTGTWDTSDGLTLSMSATNKMQFDASLSGNTLTLAGADRGYDFNDDDVWEPAKLNLTLTR